MLTRYSAVIVPLIKVAQPWPNRPGRHPSLDGCLQADQTPRAIWAKRSANASPRPTNRPRTAFGGLKALSPPLPQIALQIVGCRGGCRRDGGGRVSLRGFGGATPCLGAASRRRRGARADTQCRLGVSFQPPLGGLLILLFRPLKVQVIHSRWVNRG